MTRRSMINVLLFLSYAAVFYVVFFLLNNTLNSSSAQGLRISLVLIYASVGMGIAAQLIFDWHFTRPYRQVLTYSAWTVSALLLVLTLFNLETIACLVIGAPVLFVMLAIGLYLTRLLIAAIDGKSHYCMPLLIVPFVLPMIDASALIPTKTYAVTSQIEMKGTPQQVRALTLDVPHIQDVERPWTLTHSVFRAPRPLKAKVIKGVRYATWERGVAFQEILTETTNPNALSWSFHFPDPALLKPLDYHVSPTGPEVFMETGGYRFEPIGNDRTLVTLTTTYRLNTVMNGYLSLWGEVFLDDFHMAVLHVLAQRAEVTL